MRSTRLCLPVLLIFGISAAAQTTPSKSVLGTVTGFKVTAHQSALLVHPDNGEPSSLPFGLDTEVIRVNPGEHDLTKGEAARITDLLTGDRVLVSFVHGMKEARRVVLITANDIAKRNDAARVEWQAHAVSGVVAANDGNRVTLRAGEQTLSVTLTDQTTIRRYAPDSVKFAHAVFSNAGEISVGDQLQARGEKSEDGLSLTAKELVFGTFINTAGTVTAVDAEANRITIVDLTTKQSKSVKLTADSRLRVVPDMQHIMSHMHGGGSEQARSGDAPHPPVNGPRGMAQMIDMLPPAKIGDLKTGETVVVTSTKGNANDELTAIVLLANAEFVVQMMQAAAPGAQESHGSGNMNAILRAHGAVPGGGLALPAIIP